MEIRRIIHKLVLSSLFALILCICFCGCSADEESALYVGEDTFAVASSYADLSVYPATDISGYTTLSEEEASVRFADVTVTDIAALMDAKETFVFIAAFDRCPGCNFIMPYFCDVAKEADVDIAYLNTRKNPSWENNTQIDDYDLFVELFGEYLKEDEDGVPHLYTPHIFCIKDGSVVWESGSILEGVKDPTKPLEKEQQRDLRELLRDGFRSLI